MQTDTAAGAPIDLDGAPAIPGLRFRHFAGPQDLPAMFEVHRAHNVVDSPPQVTSLERFRHSYEHLVNCDPYRDVTIAEVDGRMVAYARVFWDELTDGTRTYQCYAFVEPAWRRRGLGTVMLARNERLLGAIAAEHGRVRPQWLESGAGDLAVGTIALLERAGYRPVRHSYEMVLRTLDDVPEVALPEGFEVRPVTRDQYRSIWEANAEAFRDHWGERTQGEEDWRRFESEPEYADPSLWQVAWDGDEIAGVVINTIPAATNAGEEPRRGYVDSVSVRRRWRRRGLARALLARSLAAMRRAGLTSASLGVDTENVTGALRLYESLGFVPKSRFTLYRKPLEETHA
jgi:mycothiol synthase